jgi:enoyl-CoA hydratase/carnithine racemase
MGATDVPSATKAAQVRLNRVTPSHCRVVLDNPPLNLMGPEFVPQIREIVTALENDDRVKVVVFESAVDGFFLNHSDFLAKFEELTSIPQGPTGLEAWPDVLVRLTRAPFVSIALIRGRATGNGSELALACDMSFANRSSASPVGGRRSAMSHSTASTSGSSEGLIVWALATIAQPQPR